MPYYIWYLATSDERVPFSEYQELVKSLDGKYSLTLIEGSDDEWVEVALAHKKNDWPIGNLRWRPVNHGFPDDAGCEEIAFFLDEIEDQPLPACNLPWLRQFLSRVRTIYCWSLYSGTDKDDGWTPVYELDEAFTDGEETAVYSEYEGWSNTDGDQITWEFLDQKQEKQYFWSFALFLENRWHRFQMDLADSERAEFFKRGEIPPGVKVQVGPLEPLNAPDNLE